MKSKKARKPKSKITSSTHDIGVDVLYGTDHRAHRKRNLDFRDHYSIPQGDGSSHQMGDSQFSDRYALAPNTHLSSSQFQKLEGPGYAYAEQIGAPITRGLDHQLIFMNAVLGGLAPN